jgi:catechol 2,3-dioxygenase-like lactoylglutathione lyase family enzyme
MDWTLEVIVVPVADVDRAKEFYEQQLGFHVDHDTMVGPERRVVQLTPPGSGCSVVLQSGSAAGMEPGSLHGVQLCVSDLPAARDQLLDRGVGVGDIQVFDGGAVRPYRAGEPLDMVGFLFFEDPDGNGWAVQQMPGRR